MLAIVLLAISAVVVGGIINASYRTSEFARNFVIAQNLANEGIEGVISLRNTNWLQHFGNQGCWLVKEPSIEAFCDGGSEHAKANVNYVATIQGGWVLIDAGVPDTTFDPLSPDPVYELYKENYDGLDIYVDSFSASDEAEPTGFYRHVIFDSIALDNSQATLTVTIAWSEGAKERFVERSVVLYNFEN